MLTVCQKLWEAPDIQTQMRPECLQKAQSLVQETGIGTNHWNTMCYNREIKFYKNIDKYVYNIYTLYVFHQSLFCPVEYVLFFLL